MKSRKPHPADLPLLAQWNHQLIWDEGHRNPMNPAQLKRRMAGWLKKEYHALIFEMNQASVGYVLYRKEKGFIYLRQFFIERKYRRRGYGRKAVELLFLKVWPRKTRILLEVLVHNQRGISFWESVGFKPYAMTFEKL